MSIIFDRDKKFINIASKYAMKSDWAGNARIGAIIVFKNRIISVGNNRKKTHPLQAEYAKNKDAIELHAEIDVIKNALRFMSNNNNLRNNLKKSILYVARIKRASQYGPFVWGMAKPCKGCQKAIKDFDIKRVVFTTDHGTFNNLTENNKY